MQTISPQQHEAHAVRGEALQEALPSLPAEAPQTLTVAGHELTVFVESPPLFEAMLRDIGQAKQRIWLETYIFYNDAGGTSIAEALKRKAREGLDVRVLYDGLGCASTPAAFFTDMQSAGVKVYGFHTILEGLRRLKPLTIINRRNHRKLLVVDDYSGYFGGMNIIDNVEDVEQVKRESRPASSGWRDVHIRLVGPQQAELADSFERSWRRAQHIRVPRRSRATGRAHLIHAVHGRGAGGENGEHAGREASAELIRFFDSEPHNRFSRAARVYAWLIGAARFQITLSMAYFIPVGAPLRALMRARRRGVRIRVVVPGKSDVKIVQRATAHLYDKLIRRGFRIYERRRRMLHSKMMVVDTLFTLVGSANLDPRSLYTNLEFVAVIRSRALAEIMQRICRFEMTQSTRVTPATCKNVSRWQRFLNGLAWGLRWWL